MPSAARPTAGRSGGRVIEVMHSGSGDDRHTGIVRVLTSGMTIIVRSNAGQHAGTTWSSWVAHHLLDQTGDAR
jgi:hypothetical protein